MGQFSMGAKPGFGVGEFTPPFYAADSLAVGELLRRVSVN